MCRICEKAKGESDLQKCAICYKAYCADCAYLFSGRTFCSQHCGEYFFFSNPDDEDN